MNIVDVLGTPVRDHTSPEIPRPPTCSTPPAVLPAPPPVVRPQKRLAAMAAAAALVLGGVGGWMAASMRPVEPAIAPPAPALTSVPADVAGTAEMFTNLYLSGTASPTDLSTWSSGGSLVTSSTASSIPCWRLSDGFPERAG